MRLYNMKYVG